ncbi:hypothetical protein JW859_04180 [bacterium]|nr:hypothetical protein [bacterium]
MGITQNERNRLQSVLKQHSKSATIHVRKQTIYIENLWYFQKEELAFSEESVEYLIDLFSISKPIPFLWGFQNINSNDIELVCPLQKSDNADYNINLKLTTYHGDISLYVNQDSQLLTVLYKYLECKQPFQIMNEFDFTLNLNAMHLQRISKSDEESKYHIVVAHLTGCPSIDTLNYQTSLDFYKRIRLAISYSAPLGPNIAVEMPENYDLEKTWFSYRPKKGLDDIRSIQVGKYDSILADILLAATKSSPRLKFIILFTAIEYLLDLNIDNDVRIAICSKLSKPNFLDQIPDVLSEIITIMRGSKISELTQRISELLASFIPVRDMHHMIIASSLHNNETKFDGGVTINRLEYTSNKNEKAYKDVSDNITHIRNNLVHYSLGSKNSIMPTTDNEKKLLPWVSLMEDIIYLAMFKLGK